MGKTMMNALVYENPREMNIRGVPIPEPGADDVLIRVEAAGICGSELSGYLGHNSLRKPPLIMGHEFAGTIAAAGERAGNFRPGERVTVNPLLSCRTCERCREGRPQLCGQRRIVGAHVPGAFAEYVCVPAASVRRLPEGVSFDAGALAEPLACAVHAVRLAGLDPADRMLIYGGGPIGLLVLQAARRFGLRDVALMELHPDRRRIAASLGAAVAGSEAELRSLMPAEGFDVVLDAVGVAATRRDSALLARPGGRVVFSGLHEAESAVPVNVVIRSELILRGAFCYDDADFDTALDWLADGTAGLDGWIQHSPLQEGKACFEKLLNDPGPVAKILLTIS
ncbi:galactitol-1-phosphate 5-dehydrogenase [Paenibacillus cisolokensis]|uniref:zinc-dependent alcohol dehydrogenase n=1 Tax=Paenibacillus cisolokensis TaxID=1658519 RepID=UPI003D279DB8